MQLSRLLGLAAVAAAVANGAALPLNPDDLLFPAPEGALIAEGFPSSSLDKEGPPGPIAEVIYYRPDASINDTVALPGEGAIKEFEAAANANRKNDAPAGGQRAPMTNHGFPFSSMGRLSICKDGGCSVCTGVLVGKRIVATARHCWKEFADITFSPAYFNGDRLPTGKVVNQVINGMRPYDGRCDQMDDWILLVLEKDTSDGGKFLGVKRWDEFAMSGKLFDTYGYPSDKSSSSAEAWVQAGINVHSTECKGSDRQGDHGLRGDAFYSPPQSGSAVYKYDEAYVVGIFSEDHFHTTLAHGKDFVGAVNWARAQYP